MARNRSGKRRKPKQPSDTTSKPPNVLQSNRNDSAFETRHSDDLSNIKSLLVDNESSIVIAGTSSSSSDGLNTESLHHELDSFRQRWKRELETKSSPSIQIEKTTSTGFTDTDDKENKPNSEEITAKEYQGGSSSLPEEQNHVYALAKKLFLTGVQLEQDEMHYESIRYYKQALHLYPDIERQLFREQSEASAKSKTESSDQNLTQASDKRSTTVERDEEVLPLYERISSALDDSSNTELFTFCRSTGRHKDGSRHISELPQDLLLQIYRYVVGQELDLASLETLGLVCRGFYLLSRDSSLWRSICCRTWGSKMLMNMDHVKDAKQVDWRKLYLEKPRVNYDGVYISRTRYIRQGDASFQDMTYRPFHVIRYYRYLRFFPDKRVLILTTNEEPERIIPIFRHALNARQFSPELSILEGTYELIDTSTLVIKAEKDFSRERSHGQQLSLYQKRQAQFHWSRQTPISQKFDYKFGLKTVESRPYKNNTLKWVDYEITTKLETGEEITTFDLTPDSFPNLAFSRVKFFNLKQTEPLSSL